MPSETAENRAHCLSVTALIDTGATKSCLRADKVAELVLTKRDRAPVQTANGTILRDLFLVRIGFWPSTDTDDDQPPAFPTMLPQEFLVNSLDPLFSHEMLLGMDVLGRCDFRLSRDHRATLILP